MPIYLVLFMAHFLCGFGLCPSYFFENICDFYIIELAHLKPNAITMLRLLV